MQRTEFDFDVISGPSTPAPRPPVQPSPAPTAPQGSEAAPRPVPERG